MYMEMNGRFRSETFANFSTAPLRGSFARSCLKPIVSRIGMEMEIVYYEVSCGVLQKVAEIVVQTRDATLGDICREALQERSLEGRSQPVLKCYSSNFEGGEGEEIDLNKKPDEVECIIDALKNDTRPVLYLFKEPSKDENSRSPAKSPLNRQGSGIIRDFIAHTPRHKRLTPPQDIAILTSPSHPSPGTGIETETNHHHPQENGVGSEEQDHRRKLSSEFADPEIKSMHGFRTVPRKKPSPEDQLVERVPSELYHCQENLIPHSTAARVNHNGTPLVQNGYTSPEEAATPEDATSPEHHSMFQPQTSNHDTFSELLKGLDTPVRELPRYSPPLYRPKLDSRTMLGESLPAIQLRDDDFLTLRSNKNARLGRDKNFTEFSRRSECFGYEGPGSPGYHDYPFSMPQGEMILKDERREGGEGGGVSGGGEAEQRRDRWGSRGSGGERKWKRRTAIRRQRKKVSGSVTEPPPDTSYSFQVDSIRAATTAGGTVCQVPCREYNTIAELKENVVKALNRHQEEETEVRWKASDLVLTYCLNEQEYELYNDYQFIYATALYQAWSQPDSGISPSNTVITVRSASRMGDKDAEIHSRLDHLTGLNLDNHIPLQNGMETGYLWRIADGDKNEVQWARRLLHSYVSSEVATRDAEGYTLSMELVSRQTSTILALKIPLDNKVEITFHYLQEFSLKKRVNVHRLASSVLEELYQCVVACGLIEQDKRRASDFVLQVSGQRSYIAGRNELLSFKDIRRCIIKGESIHLSITPKPKVEDNIPCKINMVPIDPQSNESPFHTDIAALSHKECDSQALSVWDVKSELSFQITKIAHLPVRSLPQKTPVIVEAALYHGQAQLCDACCTAPQPINGLLRMKEAITFPIAKRDVPKSAKLMFTVKEPSPRKESSASSRKTGSSKFLYWGLVSISDHQNMLRTGEVQLSLWKGNKKDGEDSYEPNPCAPAYNNPDPKAVTLTLKFESYSYPVYYPSTKPQSWTNLLGFDSDNVALRKQFQRLLDLIKEGKLHSALPIYIEKLDWTNLSKALEVYSLLTQLMEAKHFPVETALKMLDCNFPDEHVRRFAVTALDEMPDEQLEDILLQLTQALKFELHHDSALARFLLRRALHNKRIGHFFFWYLRGELNNPLYALRCGVILESYLMGCGEAMLRQFEDQVDIQVKLEEIARELKHRCSDDHAKMQSLLPELLVTHGVPTFTLTPVYNPRIRLGNLRPNKCKVMSSKKKPQMLEMYNVDPSVLTQSPTRLILKLGDDLRQDMITLRMFSLFEKLWEEDGLSDLCLIPYGCMATGPKSGFIEVVNNAKTIAEVSGVSNQSKLLDWIKSHQTNEFGELDPEKLKLAVRRFANSCAGYSVATYVLGIGDRHNDNVMVTTSGNLFHIDFGHFLGNIKYYMGFKREWAPFVLTPDFVYVMGGEEGATFDIYKNLCCRAFLTLRRKADLIINLFSLMRSTGIPELTCVEDTDYIRNALVLDKTEQEAEQLFRKVIKKCLDLKWTVQVMWKIHLLRKKGSQ